MNVATVNTYPTPHFAWAEKRLPSFQTLLFFACAALCLTSWITPAIALAMGAALALTVQSPFRAASHRVSKWLLQGSVILLGFGMNFAVVLRVGADGALLAAGTIAVTMGLGYVVGKFLRIRPGTSLLISAGTAICGGSAIAAVGSATDADEGDMSVAMGVIFLLNGLALYLFPPLGHAMHLTDHQFGTWAGIAIHDVSSVVGAASRYGLDALQTATAVKLSRALWIVPLTLVIALSKHRGQRPIATNATFGFDAGLQKTPRKVQVPWFIGLFLVASICRSFIPGVAAIAPAFSHLAEAGLTLTLFLIGTGLSAATLRAVGGKAFAQGIALWVFISAASLMLIKFA